MENVGKIEPSRGEGRPGRRVMLNRRISQQPTSTKNKAVTGISQDDSKLATGMVAQPQSAPARVTPGSTGSLNILASFAGKSRVLVISAPHESDGYYRLMTTLLKSDVYCEMAERHMQVIVMFHQEGEQAGKVRRVNTRGQVTEEPLDTALIPRLMNFLKLEVGKFGMVLLKKTLQVEERYPYPVRLEAMYDVIDQTPIRKLEKGRQRGFVQRCKADGVEGQLTKDKSTTGWEELGSDLKVDPDAEVERTSPEKVKVKQTERKKKVGKSGKKSKAEKKRLKSAKDNDGGFYHGRKPGKKGVINQGKDTDNERIAKRPSPLASFFSHFEKRRRLLVITTPDEENRMYTQQRDEYLEHVCELGLRKITLITIFGSLTNGTMKMDNYQADNDQPLRSMKEEDLTNQSLIIALRKELGLIFDDYYMVLTDFDIKVKQEYEVPIAMKAVFDYIDTFPSRIKEMEQQAKQGVVCKREDKSKSLENFLSRFRWRRRLFVISSSNDEEWAYQQQMYAMNSQACNLGLRHISVLKLFGKESEDLGGTLELYPINGTATVEREDVAPPLVNDIRNYFQVSPEYFSMLLVGKDGNVKAWYPSPMWSMSDIYDLVDSMQLRRQEMAIQQSLGMRCPEDEYGGYGHDRDPDSYHRGYGY
ncbi:hypothetical protein UPYG_G00024670 [Umbra pygmaea]|uniref:Coiled-coil domain-containing protein 80 n=1 Tax=Umbra pygmaea TaxID=75934 RepID=A0ABD0XNQ3_UMBPY